MNVLENRSNSLVDVDYSEILDAVLKVLRKDKTYFKFGGYGRIQAKASTIAESVSDRSLGSPLIGNHRSAKSATMNLEVDSTSDFHKKVRDIYDVLRDALETEAAKDNLDPSDAADRLCLPLDDLKVNNVSKPGFGYDFRSNTGIGRRKLSLQQRSQPGGDSSLSLHRLTVGVDVSKLESGLIESLERYAERQFSNEDEYEAILDHLDHVTKTEEGRSESGLGRLRELLSEWVLGIIKRESLPLYLDFLLGSIDQDATGTAELRSLRDRMLALRKFVNDPDRSDSEYTVEYGSGRCNLREKLSETTAFDALPIVPQVEGSLGENRDSKTGKFRYVYGLRFKLNGAVHSSNHSSSFEYHVDKISPDTQLHRDSLNKPFGGGRIAETAVLYAFFFDPDFGKNGASVSPLAEKVMAALRGSSHSDKEAALRELVRVLRSPQVKQKLSVLKQLLRHSIERTAVFPDRSFAAHVGVSERILETDAEVILKNGSLFDEQFQGNLKSLLKHVSVAEADRERWLISVPLSMTISNPRFSDVGEKPEQYSMSYATQDLYAMPVFLGFFGSSKSRNTVDNDGGGDVRDAYSRYIESVKQPFLMFPYRESVAQKLHQSPSGESFVYSLVFALLFQLTLELLLSYVERDVYVPILRFQTQDKTDPLPEESYFRSLSKTAAHLLSECPLKESGHRRVSRSQGIVVVPKVNQYSLKNAGSSMYAGVPMRFEHSEQPGTRNIGEAIENLAVVAVSSWESDSGKFPSYSSEPDPKISCLYGEAVTISRQRDGSVLLDQFGSFSDVYNEKRLHSNPEALREVVDALYRSGYRRVALISKSPFQSRLSLTGDEEKLYFLSKETLRFLRSSHDDLVIYPIFFNRYFVVKPGKASLKANSLYVQDVEELSELTDSGRNTVPFLHVFNGISVGKERFYNGTLAYSAVTGAYEGVMDEQATWQDLIFDRTNSKPNAVKDDIVRYLTLFHFSRFEKATGGLGFSLNPFDNLFGNADSVGGASAIPHASGSPKLNTLAFLTAVKRSILTDRDGKSGGHR